MLGIIWFVQLVHYPLLGEVAKYRKDAYEKTHMRMATWVVGPPMIIEMVTSIILIWQPVTFFPPILAWGGLSLLILIWLSTAFLQAPKHEILAAGYVEKTHRALITSNRLRTFAWSLRSALLLYAMLAFF